MITSRSTPRFRPFIITIDTTKLGSSASNQFTLPLYPFSPKYRFRVEWGDGSISKIQSYNSAALTHTYSSGGIYTIKIYGRFDSIFFNDVGDKLKLLEINQWGSVIWKNFISSFNGCSNMSGNTITDNPILLKTSNLESMFSKTKFNGGVNNWDVSKITNMRFLFYQTPFNQPLSGWNVGNVTNMGEMFFNTTNFNQNINNWDVSKVTNMYYMFQNTSNFNQPLSGWNVGNVTDMTAMFLGATNFNQPLNNWNVSKVQSMYGMFRNATSFNQPLNDWNVGKVYDMNLMFWNASSFNQNLGNWNVSGVTQMTTMLTNTSLSTTNYDSILTGWTGWIGGVPTKSVQSYVNLGVGNKKYSSSKPDVVNARTYLATTKSWSITDGGPI